MGYTINTSYLKKCVICGKTIEDIIKEFKGSDYRISKFIKHLQQSHGIGAEDYFETQCGITIPVCQCGCGKRVGVKKRISGELIFNKVILGHVDINNDKFKMAVERFKNERKGTGNPMYGKPAWNKGLSKDTNKSMLQASNTAKSKHRKIDGWQKELLSKAMFKYYENHTHPMFGKTHSEETRNKIRIKTFEQIKRGCFTQIKSKPHIAMSTIFDSLCIRYEEEKQKGFFSFDFYLIDYDMYVEVDGDYFHSNPKFYPDGPKTKTQKINWYRDIKKNEYSKENNLCVFRFWEDDIINRHEEIKEKIKGLICNHQELKKSGTLEELESGI